MDETSKKSKPNVIDAGIPNLERPQGLQAYPLKTLSFLKVGTQQPPIRVRKERVVLGSIASADVRLQGDGISPIHAVIEFNRDLSEARIFDLASDTGVFVNQKKVVVQVLAQGDTLTLGRFQIKFEVEDPSQPISNAQKQAFEEEQKIHGELLLEQPENSESIFDYRPDEKPALEVVYSWYGSILDIEHFVNRSRITIGKNRYCDFAIPPLLPESSQTWILQKQGITTLNLFQAMTGVIQRAGRLDRIEDLRKEAGFREAPTQTLSITLGPNDFARVRLGTLDFYLSFTAAPPHLKRKRLFERDPFFSRIFFSSLAMTGALIFALYQVPVSPMIEAEKIPERVATVLYQPEKYTAKVEKKLPEPPTPEAKAPEKVEPKKTVTKLEIKPSAKKAVVVEAKTMAPKADPKKELKAAPKNAPKNETYSAITANQNEAKEGAGARAKGNEGARGKPGAPKVAGVEPQTKMTRPSPQGGPGSGAQGNSQVADEGNVDFLKGATSRITHLLGSSGEKLGKGGSKLEGFGTFTTEGQGGKALSGTGKGGGGTADSIGGLADQGRGGGRVGTGLGAAGQGSGMLGGKTRVAIHSGGAEEAVVMGAIDADAVEAALLAHKDEFRLCYEREINANQPKLSGRVGTTFVIGSTGRVSQAGIESSTLKNSEVESCIVSVIKRIDFPMPKGAGIVQVTYPFKFNASGK